MHLLRFRTNIMALVAGQINALIIIIIGPGISLYCNLNVLEAGEETSLGVVTRLRPKLRHTACCVPA